MAFESPHFLAALEIPNQHHAIRGSGGHEAVIGGDRHGQDTVNELSILTTLNAGIQIPKSNGLIPRAGDQTPSVLRNRHGTGS